MAFVLKLLDLASGGTYHRACGRYVVEYDPSADGFLHYDGGRLETTVDRSRAKRFKTKEAAVAFWMTQAPEPWSIRPDGFPNRPLTAFHAAVEEVFE